MMVVVPAAGCEFGTVGPDPAFPERAAIPTDSQTDPLVLAGGEHDIAFSVKIVGSIPGEGNPLTIEPDFHFVILQMLVLPGAGQANEELVSIRIGGSPDHFRHHSGLINRIFPAPMMSPGNMVPLVPMPERYQQGRSENQADEYADGQEDPLFA